MGNYFTTDGKVGRPKNGRPLKANAARSDMEGESAVSWVSGAEQQVVAGEIVLKKGRVIWLVDALELNRPVGVQDRANNNQLSWVSEMFSIPESWVSGNCKELIAEQKWQLSWECSQDGGCPRLNLYLRCPSVALESKWKHLAVCSEFSLKAKIVENSYAESGSSRATCGTKRKEWLSHAFTALQPDWGLRGMLSELQVQANSNTGLAVELCFEGLAAYLQDDPPGLVLHHRPLLLQISEEPCILAVDNFLTPEQCRDVIDLAQPLIKRSRVSAGDETPLRTSSGMFITGAVAQHPVSVELDAKLQELADMACRLKKRRKLVLSEATQVVRYFKGEYYAEHYDNKAGDCAKRAATIMVYLSGVQAGGCTSFSRSSGVPLNRALEMCVAGNNNHPAAPVSPCAQSKGKQFTKASIPCETFHAGYPEEATTGIRIEPREGKAIVFWSRLPNGREDRASLHAAEPVECGVKWIITRWCKEDD